MNKENTTFVSFLGPLEKLCLIQNPDFVLEFGPGYSTNIFLHHTSANIVSIESDIMWFFRYKIKFTQKRLRLVYTPRGKALANPIPSSAHSPLVFIDGGDRLARLNWIFKILPEGGSVYLHDAHREDYERGIRRYPYIFFPERHSAILFKQNGLYNQVKDQMSVDYSCKCKYCSTPARRAYFDQFAEKNTG